MSKKEEKATELATQLVQEATKNDLLEKKLQELERQQEDLIRENLHLKRNREAHE